METNPSIDSVLSKSNENPPVHPHLIEHLREKFSRPAPYAGVSMEEAFRYQVMQAGHEAVIDYLESLVKQGDTPDEFEQTEGAGPDPRRPGSRARG